MTTLIRRGAVVTLYLDCPTLIIRPPVLQQIVWKGEEANRAIFVAKVPPGITDPTINGTLHVSLGGIPIGEVAFNIHVRLAADGDAAAKSLVVGPYEPIGSSAKRFRSAFISYSRKDFDVVSFFAQGLGENGIRPLIDVGTLVPGDEWETQLPQFVEKADVFYLMWSDSAATSQYVDWEARHAVGLHGASKRPRIRPIPLHQPWPEPPDYLQRFHFYSEWQAHRAAQLIGLTKPAGVPPSQ